MQKSWPAYIDIRLELFDSLVIPIMLYGCEENSVAVLEKVFEVFAES